MRFFSRSITTAFAVHSWIVQLTPASIPHAGESYFGLHRLLKQILNLLIARLMRAASHAALF